MLDFTRRILVQDEVQQPLNWSLCISYISQCTKCSRSISISGTMSVIKIRTFESRFYASLLRQRIGCARMRGRQALRRNDESSTSTKEDEISISLGLSRYKTRPKQHASGDKK